MVSLRCWWRGYHEAAVEISKGWWRCQCGLGLSYCPGLGTRWKAVHGGAHIMPGGPKEHPHLIDGEFQSDKYPTTPRGKVPLSCKDKTAQPLLWKYAQIHRSVDAQFSDDLEIALRNHGYVPEPGALELTDEELEALGTCVRAASASYGARVSAEEALRKLNARAGSGGAGESKKLTRSGYERLIAEDLAWLRSTPRTLERDHVILIVEQSVEQEYPRPTPDGASGARCKHCGTDDEVTTHDGVSICLSCLVEHHPPGNARAIGAKCERCGGSGAVVERHGDPLRPVSGTFRCEDCHGTGARPSPEPIRFTPPSADAETRIDRDGKPDAGNKTK